MSVHTFRTLTDQILRHLDEVTNQGTTRALVEDTLNLMHQQRCASHPWLFMLWPRAITLNLQPSVTEYALHPAWDRPFYLYNETTRRFLVEVPTRAIAQGIAHEQDTGAVDYFSYFGTQPVAVQPPTPGPITIVSTSSLDSGASYAVVIEGESAGGSLVSETLVPSGTTPVAGSTSFKTIINVTKTADWNGTMTLSDGGSTELLSLGASEPGRSHRVITLLRAPTRASTVSYRFFRQPRSLERDRDLPEIPFPHSGVLVWDTLLAMAAYQTDARPTQIALWQDFQSRAETAMNLALMTEQQTIGAQPVFIEDRANEEYHPRILGG